MNKGCGCHYLNYLSTFSFFYFAAARHRAKCECIQIELVCLKLNKLSSVFFFFFLDVSLSWLLGQQALIQHVMICVV